jgi:hypothetical protein
LGRKRIDLGAGSQAKIALMMSGGHGPERIAAELGVSLATAKRRMSEVKGVVTEVKGDARRERRAAAPAAPAARAPTPHADLDTNDDDAPVIPEGSSLEQIDKWLKVAEEEAALAATDDDPDNHIKWVRLAASLLEARRKAAPIPKADPNENPDMIEAAAAARKRWHDLADALLRVSKSPVAGTIASLLKERAS